MKWVHLLSVGLSFLVTSCALDDFHNKSAASTKGSLKTVQVKATAYTHSESGHRRYGRSNAVGTQLAVGGCNSAAADWSRFPLGTKFRILGQKQLYVIDDYGSALVGKNTIDLYMPSRAMMNRWGSRDVTIELLELGSYSDSLEILRPRCRAGYIRRMVSILQFKIYPAPAGETGLRKAPPPIRRHSAFFSLGSPENPASLTPCECIRHRRGRLHWECLC